MYVISFVIHDPEEDTTLDSHNAVMWMSMALSFIWFLILAIALPVTAIHTTSTIKDYTSKSN